MSLRGSLHFFRSYLNEPSVVGAVLPSSSRLGAALLRPFAGRDAAARVLEIGAGTGSITECITDRMRPDDHLDICEINRDFANRIESKVLAAPRLQRARRRGRIRVLCCPAEAIVDVEGYDFIVSGLPLTAFEPRLVKAILSSVRRNLRPGGVFSYFEYVGLRRLNRSLAMGKSRRRIRRVSALLDYNIKRHQFSRETVLSNIPPAHARHWRFEAVAS